LRDERGAMFLMGIPICFFMIGLLYFVFGIGEDLVLRERVQDAADAGALSAAVVHARAMNLIALLNQVMAALVALLIMVRMLEVLLIAAMAIAAALAYFTAGASLSIVPGCEVAREEAANAWDALNEVVEPLVEALHYLEVGIQYGMPAVAEARVISTTAKFKPVVKFGFAIPGDYPLPLKNGTWPDLCHQGGVFAGQMLTYPIKMLIPVDAVSSAISGAMGELTKTFPQTFCGQGGLAIPPEMPAVKLDKPISKSVPALDSTNTCTSPQSDSLQSDFEVGDNGLPVNMSGSTRDGQEETRIEEQANICKQSARDQAMSRPAPDGSPNTSCVYNWQDRGSQTVQELPCDSANPNGGCLKGSTPCEQFSKKVDKAAEACKPGKEANISSYNYQVQALTWRAELTPVPNCGSERDACKYTIKFTTARPDHKESFVSTAQPPCGTNPQGSIGPEYNASARWRSDGVYSDSEYLCVQPHTVVEPSMLESKQDLTLQEWQSEFKVTDPNPGWTTYTEPYVEPPRPDDLPTDSPWPPPTQQPPNVPNERLVFIGAWNAVTYLHSCDQTVNNFAESQDYKDQAARAAKEEGERAVKQGAQQATNQAAGAVGGALGGGGGSECGGEGDDVHMVMKDADKDNQLGGETFQMRAIVIRRTRTSPAKAVVRNMPLRLRRGGVKEDGDPLGPFFGDAINRIFAAQAEYYFDGTFNPDSSDEDLDRVFQKRTEWTWHMDWKARMRRLRITSDSDDSSDSSSSSNSSSSSSSSNSGGDKCTGGTSPPTSDINERYSNGAKGADSDDRDDSSGSGGSDSVSTLQRIESLIIH
jgi:hypothetical protein